MHELAICQALISQIEAISRDNDASSVASITLGLGPLSGVEEHLLRHAYPVASAGTIADGAELKIQSTPVRVRCSECGKESSAKPNRLLCGFCEDWRTELISGDELLLVQLELDKAKIPTPGPLAQTKQTPAN
jgi:hydrogenase nickel incorporation protein HypA/HybF